MKDISFKSDGLRLDATIFYPETLKDKNPTILFIHGWTSQRTRSFQYAKSLVKMGYICFLVDLRGHGTSEGDHLKFVIKDFLQDAINSYDYLANLKGVDRENISAVGSSFGGYLVALLTSKREIKNVVMRVPADYPDDEFEKLKKDNAGGSDPKVRTWRRQKRDSDSTMALSALHNFGGGVLIIEAEKDDIVPHETIMNYVTAAKNPKHVILEGAPHSIKDGPIKDRVERILTDWFASLL